MAYKTKKNNRRKKIKDIQRKQTKKQIYYGGEDPIVKEHNNDGINAVSANLSSVDSKVTNIKSSIDGMNNQASNVKNKVANGLSSVTGGVYSFFTNGLKNIVQTVGKKTLEQGGEAAAIVMNAAKKPLEEASGTFNKLGEDAAKNVAVGAVNVITDAAAAVPGLGAMVEAGKVATDLATTASKGVKILEKVVDTAGDVMDKTQENIEKNLNALPTPNIAIPTPNIKLPTPDINGAIEKNMGEGLNKLENASNDAANNLNTKLTIPDNLQNAQKGGGLNNLSNIKQQIGGRINDSIGEFINPIKYQSGILKGGNNKTKKAFVTGKNSKTKHVYFSF